jgi:hypothetical protein
MAARGLHPADSLAFVCPHRAGISSFAYQGTNSHVVAGAPVEPAVPQQQAMMWQCARFWYQVRICKHFCLLLAQHLLKVQTMDLIVSCDISPAEVHVPVG